MNGLRVLKFGGAALRDGSGVLRAAGLVRRHGGPRVIVVVSALEGVTEALRQAGEQARVGILAWDGIRVRHRSVLRETGLEGEILDRLLLEFRSILEHLISGGDLDVRVLDHLLSFGERMSARILAAVLRRDGLAATPFDAFDLGLSAGPDANGDIAGAEDLERSLAGGSIPVVTGFLAMDSAGGLTTLGANGSDLTAAWIGAALGAEEVQLWKTVPGIMTTDPRVDPEARLIEELDYGTAEELALGGADVLHPGTVEPLRRAGIPLRILSVLDPDGPGTRVCSRAEAHRCRETTSLV